MKDTLYARMRPYLGDEKKLSERMAGRLDFWEECVMLFPKEEIIEEMDKALEDNDFSVFWTFVHRLKGNLANFGFERASEKAADVLLMIERKDTQQLRYRYESLREEYLQIIERIKEVK